MRRPLTKITTFTRITKDFMVFVIFVMALAAARPVRAADKWIEIKSAHFTVISQAGEGSAKTIAWQLEQIRSAIATLWPWAKVDLNRPLSVFVVKDETALKALAPMYWERKGGTRPATVWVGGADQNYLAIRTDVEAEDVLNINPYVSSYFSYVSLILQQSVPRPLPLWFSRGLAGVMSNTIVRDSRIMLGPPIPWHLERLRDRRMKVPALLQVTRNSREYLNGEGLSTFDAASWALVHYLMFGESGARWPKLDRFAQLVAQGTDAGVAFREVLGSPEDLDGPFDVYINRSLFSFRQINVDVAVKREGFAVRAIPAPEAASRQALFHAAMGRPDEARRAIDEARKAGAAPEASVAEGLLLDAASGKEDEAKAAYARAVEADSTQPYAYYRLASLLWRPQADRDTLVRIEKLLSQAVNLNNRYASAYAFLGEVRSQLGIGEPIAVVLRAISLEPAEPHYRLTAASVLQHERKYDDALKHAQAALSLADTDEERRRATEMIDALTRAKGD